MRSSDYTTLTSCLQQNGWGAATHSRLQALHPTAVCLSAYRANRSGKRVVHRRTLSFEILEDPVRLLASASIALWSWGLLCDALFCRLSLLLLLLVFSLLLLSRLSLCCSFCFFLVIFSSLFSAAAASLFVFPVLNFFLLWLRTLR